MVSGIRRVKKAIRRLPQQISDGAMEAVKEAAEEAHDTATTLVPVDTGHLRSSIELRIEEEARTAVVGVWDEQALEYAAYVEHGTSKMRAQPYLTPALQQARRGFNRRIIRHVRAQIGA